MVAYIVERFHDRGPIVVAFEVFDGETGGEAVFFHSLAAVFLHVKLVDAFAQDANPLLGPAEINDVAYIKVPGGGGAVQFVHEPGRLKRTEQEMVPSVFNGELDA